MINKSMFTSLDSEWETPDALFDLLNTRFGPFDLDPAASPENARAPKYYTRKENGLILPWNHYLEKTKVWLNPPYGKEIIKWVRKCSEERDNVQIIVALLPARTDTKWFHKYVFPFTCEIVFLEGRVHFKGALSGATFPNIIAIYRSDKDKFLTYVPPVIEVMKCPKN